MPVISKPLDATTHLEAELTPYEAVALHARVNGFVQRVLLGSVATRLMRHSTRSLLIVPPATEDLFIRR